jgi:hypothetical protein
MPEVKHQKFLLGFSLARAHIMRPDDRGFL